MNTILENILTILLVNGPVLIIPGVNFFLIARFALLYGIMPGLYCAAGVTSAIMIHVFLSIISVNFLMNNYPNLFLGIRYIGAAYLFYLATKFLMNALNKNLVCQATVTAIDSSKKNGFYTGFLTDLFNPFISIFTLSLFSLIEPKHNVIFELSCYCFTIFVINLSWFSLVALFFSNSYMMSYLQDKTKQIQGLTGLAFYYFSTRLVFDF